MAKEKMIELKTVNINWKTWDNILKFKADYNEKRDILFIYSEEDRLAVSVDCNGEFWVRVDPDNGDILGVEIEDFKKVFLKKHPEISNEGTQYIRPIVDFGRLTNCTA